MDAFASVISNNLNIVKISVDLTVILCTHLQGLARDLQGRIAALKDFFPSSNPASRFAAWEGADLYHDCYGDPEYRVQLLRHECNRTPIGGLVVPDGEINQRFFQPQKLDQLLVFHRLVQPLLGSR